MPVMSARFMCPSSLGCRSQVRVEGPLGNHSAGGSIRHTATSRPTSSSTGRLERAGPSGTHWTAQKRDRERVHDQYRFIVMRVTAPSAPRAPKTRSRVLAWVPGVTLLSLTILVVWRTGPGPVPNVAGFEGIARVWPFFTVPSDQAYVLREALGQALYRASGWAGAGHFIAFHAIALVVSGVVLALWMLHRLGAQRGTISTCLLLLSPLTAVLLEWIGMYDAFSVLV